MKKLSESLIKKEITREQAQKEAQVYIKEQNPWQYVNVCEVEKGDIVDLSGGGLHHSWEEDLVHYPLGNILYEVQQDVMDPVCTIRSFDQGKFKDDGTIREIHIDDYFKHIDLDERRNTFKVEKSENGVLFDTAHYSLTLLSIIGSKEMECKSSFHHLFVQVGEVEVADEAANKVHVGQGHSCFIPRGLKYNINSLSKSEVLLTFLR